MATKIQITLIFFLALALRLVVVFSAHHGDLNNNISWGQIASRNGFNGFYGSANSDDWPYSAPNQPPLYVVVFAAVGKAWDVIGSKVWDFNVNYRLFPSKLVWLWDEKGLDFLAKLPPMVADLGIGIFIYFYLRKNTKKALMFSALWLFNPISWYNSTVWGQTDSIVNLLGLIAIYMLLNKRLVAFTVWITLSLLFKSSLAVFAPVLVYLAIRQKHSLKVWATSIVFALGTAFVVGIWFHPKTDYFVWLIELYQERILPGEIGSLSANAFNFWWLVDRSTTLDSVSLLGISARLGGFIITLTLTVFVIIKNLKAFLSKNTIWYLLSMSAMIAFLFMTRIHPRYLYPFFPAMTLFLAFQPALWPVYVLLSLIHLLNIYYLFWIPPWKFLESLYAFPLMSTVLAWSLIVLFIILARIKPGYKVKKLDHI